MHLELFYDASRRARLVTFVLESVREASKSGAECSTILRFLLTLITLALVLLCALVCAVTAFNIIPDYAPDERIYFESPRLQYIGPYGKNFTANPVRGILRSTTSKNPDFDLNGTALIYDLKSGESRESVAERFKDTGLVALITVLTAFSNTPGSGNWIRSGARPDQPFPLYEMSRKANDSLAKWYQNQTNGVTAEFWDEENKWDTAYRIGVPIVGFYILLHNCLIAVTALYKLTITCWEHGVQLSIPQTVFFLNLLGAMLRIVWSASDPLGAWGTTNFLFSQVFMTISFPLTVCSTLLISLYWHEMVSRTSGKKPAIFLRKLKIPFLIFIAVVEVWEIGISIARGFYISLVVIIFIDGAIYVFTTLGVVIFFIVSRVRLQKVFDKLNSSLSNSSRKQRLTLATYHFIGITACMVGWIILLLLGASSLSGSPAGFPTIWGLFFLMLNLVAHFQVLMVRAPQRSWKWIFCGLFYSNPNKLLDSEESSGNTATSNSKRMSTSYSTASSAGPHKNAISKL